MTSRTTWAMMLGAIATPVAVVAQAQTGVITGRITEAESGQPIPAAQLQVVGTNVGSSTNDQGRFSLRGVPARSVTIRLLRIGFTEQSRTVVVPAGGTVTLDFTLRRTVVTLAPVVATATGATRRVELGNQIATVDASRRAAEAPVRNVGDLLTAQAPGVQVQGNNFAGAGSRIRIRGTSSLSLSNDPIYFVDGVRITSNNGSSSIGVGGTLPSRVNDINPEDIESIEVVRGPSAATLYGTDAANGVIVITTKRGRAGRTEATALAEFGTIQDKNKYPDNYTLLGTGAGATNGACQLAQVVAGRCTVTGVARFNPLADPDVTYLDNGTRQQYGLGVRGGTEAVRYNVSANFSGEVGPYKTPEFDLRRFETNNVSVRGQTLHPSAFNRTSFLSNVDFAPSSKLDLSAHANVLNINYRVPQSDNNITGAFINALGASGVRDTLGLKGLAGYSQYTPGDIFQETVGQRVNRVIGSTTANYRPTGWLLARGDFGIDFASRLDTDLCRRGECANFGTSRQGFATQNRADLRTVTVNLNATGTWNPLNWLNSQTTLGTQYVNFRQDQNSASGNILPPGAQTVTATTTQFASEATNLDKTLGVFVQEQLGVRDRLFVTGALRSDQNSAFGTNFQRVYYPKVSVSYLISQEEWFPKSSALSTLRILSAYGAAGRQPGSNDALRFLAPQQTSVAGTDQPAVLFSALGNKDLKPERATEFEGGFEAGLFNGRSNLTLTYYSKYNRDALIARVIPPSAGSGVGNTTQATTRLENLGAVKNAGLEALLNVTLLRTAQVGWDVTVNGSRNDNKLVSLGGVPPQIGTTSRQVAGYPLNGYWQRKILGYADANKDGLIAPSEVQVDTAATFIGYSIPRTEVSVTSGFDLFNRQVRVQGLVDHKGGFYLYNNTERFRCANQGNCRGLNDPGAPLFEQARAIALTQDPSRTFAGYMEKADFTRFRELSVAYTPSQGAVLRALGGRRTTIALSARNLNVWTKYSGIDPETNYNSGGNAAGAGELPQDFFTAPPQRYYTVRVNLGF